MIKSFNCGMDFAGRPFKIEPKEIFPFSVINSYAKNFSSLEKKMHLKIQNLKRISLRQPTNQKKRQASQQFSMPNTVSRVGKQMVETAAEIMEITVRSAGMAMADAIISHHVLSSTALLSQDLSERELCAL